MKNYFEFTLTGKKFLPIWLLYYLVAIIPMGVYYYEKYAPGTHRIQDPYLGLLLWFSVISGLLIYYLIARLTIEHVRYGETGFRFDGRFWTFAGKVLLGLFLTVITFGIYGAWFARDISRFFIDNSSHNGNEFRFKGSGSTLFVIVLLVIIIPVILFFIFAALLYTVKDGPLVLNITPILFMLILAIPYYYLYYNWLVNINYKDYHIQWNTEWHHSIGKIALEVLLTVITLGIYLPMAFLRLYTYFSARTTAQKEDGAYVFGYDIEPGADFLFIWGQWLLTIVTLGFYRPWAYVRIRKRILSKTYVTAVNEH
ncbi:DUF898 family protein [Prolixibacter denitrificans]|uniref:Uncharacterized membrane protein YjgN (DUF898 family) n=1 Tax=Prolixibacter denitrificans TaxID=1541063 RepID=A0A2P8CF53_9BACT|nr:DUF898 family protein [Prolixibacter denitrificans]PSK83588.1 uncharacterized membrane protein YjgN (DUF898 family) [Prolixibacter denitrificans]GET23137.1 hypothetical protein JCM18694_33830 [Prolixibacter denitrificans]